VRADWRDALREKGGEYVYVAEVVRTTVGLRFDPIQHVAVKAEYTINREIDPVPEFFNDVFTTSLVGYF